jgi:hypothetical protein
LVDAAKQNNKKLILFKVAYDFGYWGYLDPLMNKMGFPTCSGEQLGG